MGVIMKFVLIAHCVELVLFIVCAYGRLEEGFEHMLLLVHWGNDPVLAPYNHGLATGITVKDDANIVLVIDMHLGGERAERAIWIGGQWPSS